MAVSIKSKSEIELMREAGRILAITHEELRKQVNPECLHTKWTESEKKLFAVLDVYHLF